MSLFFPARALGVGIGVETAFGVVAAPAALLPVTAFTPADKVGLAADTSWRGDVASTAGHQLATREGSIQLAGPVYPDSIGYPLAGILGDLAVSGAGPYTWQMAALNSGSQQPHSYTLVSRDGLGALAYPGCRFTDVEINGDSAALLTWTGQAACLAGATSSATIPAAGSLQPLPTWRAAVSLGGVQVGYCRTFTVKLARTVAAKRNTTGQVDPNLQRALDLTVTGTATLITTTDAWRQAALAATQTSVDITITVGTYRLTLHSSLAYLTAAPREYGSQWIETALAWTADGNTSDAGVSGGLSPIAATLVNNQPAGSY